MAYRPYTFDDDILGMKVREKETRRKCIVTHQSKEHVWSGFDGARLTYSQLFETYEHLDGTPCGVEIDDPEPDLPDSMLPGQWAAKDENGDVWIYAEKPLLKDKYWHEYECGGVMANITSFNDIPWDKCCFQKK